MSATAEPQTAPKEPETKRHDSISSSPIPEQASEGDGGLFSRVFGGAPGEPPPVDRASQFLRNPAFSHAVNNGLRVLALKQTQQTYGNRVAQRVVAGIQRKPTTSRLVQRQCDCGGTCETCRSEGIASPAIDPSSVLSSSFRLMQRRASSEAGSSVPESGEEKLISSDSPGDSLDEQTRDFMESRFGSDFKHVHVHTDRAAAHSAEALEANAYTSGRDIYFASGKYAPGTAEGNHLIAHELAHTLQQSSGRVPDSGLAFQTANGIVVGHPEDPLEHEADQAADAVARQGGAVVRGQMTSGPVNLAPASGLAILRQTDVPNEDRIAQLRRYLEDDDERAALDLMAQLSGAEVARVLADAGLRGLAASAFNDSEMVAAIRNMGGAAVPSLRWLFAEGVDYADFRDWLAGPPNGIGDVLSSDEMRNGFVSACDDEEMTEVVKNLRGPLVRKMDWLRAEGVGYDNARDVIQAAPAAERPTLYDHDDLRDWFVDICDDILMQNLVLELGGTLRQKLGWMRAEGSSWTLLRVVLMQGASAAERSQVLDDADMRSFFQETLDDEEMAEAVNLLGGELSQRMEWLHAEGADIAPAGVRELPGIAARDRALIETLDRRSDLFTRFKAIEDAEALYQAEAMSAGMAGIGPSADSLQRVVDARNALNTSLRAEGYGSIEAFLDEIRRFEAFFHGFALQTAYAMLAENRQLAERERDRYGSGGELDAAWEALAPLRARLPAVRASEAALREARQIELRNPRDTPFELPFVKESREALEAEQRSAIESVRPAFGRFPILANTEVQGRIFAVAEDRAALAQLFKGSSISTIEKIDEVGRDLAADTSKIWQMEPVIGRAKASLGIIEGSAMDGIIRRKLADVRSDSMWKSLVIGALALGLGLLSGGTGAVAVLAAAGALGLSAWGAMEHWEEFQFQTAARGSAIDPAQALSQVEPSAMWLAVDIVGVFLDLHGLVVAMRGLSGPARALATARTAEEAEQQAAALQQAARQAAGNGEVSGALRAGESLETAVSRSAQRIAARRATLASNAELVATIRSRAPQLAEDEAALAGLARMGRDGAEQAIRTFGDSPELLRRLARLADADPALARGAASLHAVLGEGAVAPVLRDVLLRSDPSRARSLLAAAGEGRLTREQLIRIAEAARGADEAGRAHAVAEAIDRELTSATGLPAPGSQAEREALAATSKLEGPITDPVAQLQTEWRYVERSTPMPIREGDYVAEVALPNGHRWRQNRAGNWCRFSGEVCIPEHVMRDLREAGGAVTGRVSRAEFRVTTQAPIDWPIVRIDPKHPPDVVPDGVVLEFPTGERVWRTTGGDRGIVIESRLGAGGRRQDFEAAYFSRKEMELPGYVKSDLERAHGQGAGTGFESPYAIPYAPREVNQTLQNLGIEEFMRELQRNQPEGVVFNLMTNTRVHPDTRRLSLIEYTVTSTYRGERRTLFSTGIRVEGTLEKPVVSIARDLTEVNSEAFELLPLNDLAESMLQRRLNMIARRARK